MAQPALKATINQWMMNETIKQMKMIAITAFNKNACFLTQDEFIEAFIMTEHIEKLFEVYNLIGGQHASDLSVRLSNNNNLPGEDHGNALIAQAHFHSQPSFLVPTYVKTGLRMDTPAGAKVLAWAAERRRLGIMVADGVEALEWLNMRCGNGKAMSLMFPALGALMIRAGGKQEDHAITKKARTIANTASVGFIPKLPRYVVDYIQDIAALMQSLIMTENAFVPVPDGTCVTLTGTTSPSDLKIFERPHPTEENTNVRSFV